MSGKSQDDILIGNQVDKANVKNPIGRWLVEGFDRALFELIAMASPTSVHEVGCGEGRLARLIQVKLGVPFRASDFSTELCAENQRLGPGGIEFVCRSIYDLDPGEDRADLVLCCEVLEHLEEPERGLRALRALGARSYILSVPNEPLWRVLNCARCQYLAQLGNTPGHLNHWSPPGFRRLLEKNGFVLRARRQPLPWTMVYGSFAP